MSSQAPVNDRTIVGRRPRGNTPSPLAVELASTQRPARQTLGALTTALAVLAIGVAAWVGLWHAHVPAPGGMNLEPTVFSSARAMSTVRFISRHSHPIGTQAHTDVRAHLLAELAGMGLRPQEQIGIGLGLQEHPRSAGFVHNIVARMPGQVPGKAVMLAAHYDSAPNSPGAADDGAAVAAILETVRAVRASKPLRNDLIVLFTDGEEAGLLGAQLFVDQHPWAPQVGAALNFEYRGNKGPMLMFETSTGNANLIRALQQVPLPLGNSLMYEIYKRLPNDTDMSAFKRAGMPGLGFAAIEGMTHYHSPLDRADALQEGSLQHLGETMLALVQIFGSIAIDALPADDSVYFDMAGVGLVAYSAAWIWPLTLGLTGLFAGVLVLGLRHAVLRPAAVAAGAGGFVLVAGLVAGLSHLMWQGLLWLRPEYEHMLFGEPYDASAYLLAFVALAGVGFCMAHAVLEHWLRPLEMGLGTLGGSIALLVTASIWLPGATGLWVATLMPVVLSQLLCVSRWGLRQPLPTQVALGLIGIMPGVLVHAPFVRQTFFALTPQGVAAAMLPMLVLLGMSAPVLSALARRQWLAGSLLLGGGLGLLFTVMNAGFDEHRPRPNSLSYVQVGSGGNAHWLSWDSALDEWTRPHFRGASGPAPLPEVFGERPVRVWHGPAPSVYLPVPLLDVLSDVVLAGQRQVTLRIRSRRRAAMLAVGIEGTPVLSSRFEGRLVSETADPAWRLQAFGVPPEGALLELTLASGAPFRIRLVDRSYGLPFPEMDRRPASMVALPMGSDLTQVVSTTELQ